MATPRKQVILEHFYDGEDATPPIETKPLLDAFLELNVPEGFRAQLMDEEIVVTPPATWVHENNFSKLAAQFFRRMEDIDISGGLGLIVPGGRFIPDITIAVEDSFDVAEEWHEPAGVLLVAEVTSPSTAHRDHDQKKRGYSAAAIPAYLLIERNERVLYLHTEPSDGGYAVTRTAKFGEKLPLPEPFGFELDTSKLI